MCSEWIPRTPDWVTPPKRQIVDEHWLAYSTLITTRRPWAAGVAAAVAWVRGGRVGPITYRDEQPVTRDIAEAERWAAEASTDPAGALPLDLIYAQLKVAPVAPQPGLDVRYCLGAWRALRWLLGTPGQHAPLDVPRRHADGRLFTADDLYVDATRGDDAHLSPERRAEIRRSCGAHADRYARYDEQITAMQKITRAS